MSTEHISYDTAFYADLKNTAGPSAGIITPIVQDLVHARRVVDVGCGDGSWLAAFKACGAETILGLDGDWLDEALLRIPPENFQRADLFAPISLPDRYDLAMSLEVAEHLPVDRAASFVGDLVRLAPVVLFSAAIPLQEGPNHINEQWPSYWAGLFAAHGYVPVDAVRMRVWNDPDVTWWYKQNTLIFADEDKLADYPPLLEAHRISGGQVRDLVHPDKYRHLAKRAQPDLGRWLKMFPRTFAKRQKV